MGTVGRLRNGQTLRTRPAQGTWILLCRTRTELSWLLSSAMTRLGRSVRRAAGRNCPTPRLCPQRNPVVRSWHRPCRVALLRMAAMDEAATVRCYLIT